MKVSVKKYALALALSLKGEKDETLCDEKIHNFLKLLQKRKKLKLAKRLMPAFKKEWYRLSEKVEVNVTIPYKFSEKEEAELIELLKEAFKKDVILEVKVDEKIIGGLKMQIDEYVIDGTLEKNLEMLKTRMTGTQRTE